MPLFEMTTDKLAAVGRPTFSMLGIKEREHLQTMLVNDLDPVIDDCLVLAEEFSEWQDSNRRIDILALDKNANLVVVELKRTEDGGHAELQALRYAAMVRTLTFEQAVEAHRKHLEKRNITSNAEENLLNFLGWEEPEEDEFAQNVRIVLVSGGFGPELTSTVMWLQTFGIDIRCVSLQLYGHGETRFVHVEQVLPLPGAADLQVRLNEKSSKVRKAQSRNNDRFDIAIGDSIYGKQAKRRAILIVMRQLAKVGISPTSAFDQLEWRTDSRRELVVDGEHARRTFVPAAADALKKHTDEVAKRWFVEDDELIVHEGKTYAVSSQWGARTEEALHILEDRFPNAGFHVEKATS